MLAARPERAHVLKYSNPGLAAGMYESVLCLAGLSPGGHSPHRGPGVGPYTRHSPRRQAPCRAMD